MSKFFRDLKEGFSLGRKLSAIAAEYEHSPDLPDRLRAALARDDRERSARVVRLHQDKPVDEEHSKAA